MASLRNAEIKTSQDETTGKWHAAAINPRNGEPVMATYEMHRPATDGKKGGYETEQEAIDALITAYRRAIGG